MTGIEDKKARLPAPEHVQPDVSIGTFISDVEATLADLDRRDIVRRIWQKDHTVWKPEPAEISNRLGWLTVTELMSDYIGNFETFAKEVKKAKFPNVILFGMGGSSLGPEVLRQTFGSAKGFPELIVLEAGACIVPTHMQAVTDAIEPLDTLFLVSSKSGSTIEPLSLSDYFIDLLQTAIGKEKAGQNMVAITDPESPLVRLAEETGFDRVYLNPPDIGGRYSVLSAFGLVPAALIGINISLLLERAETMREACASCVPVHENPGAWLGAYMGTLALKGRDKLTLLISPAISSFGLWVEQLIAESTGKEGKGIIPIVSEPPVEAKRYGDDRLFVYMRLDGDDNAAIDALAERIKAAGHPLLRLEMRDKYDLGAEFFRWEFATAVTGAILGVNPFDQPDVTRAKDATERVLHKFQKSGRSKHLESVGSLGELLSKAQKGSYLAIMAYVCQSTEMDEAFGALRSRIVRQYHIATTLGYGPRFLHSTGQLHKGGPNTGLFLQITADHEEDIPIPGKPYTLGVLADAQALGDLEALQTLGRHVASIHFSRADAKAILKLVEELEQG